MKSKERQNDIIEGITFETDSNIIVEISKSNLELVMSGLRLSKDAKRELGAKLILDNHIINQTQIEQLTQDIENINSMIKEYGEMLYGGMLE